MRANEGRDWEHPALTAARKASTLRKGAPSAADVPPPRPLPATKASAAAKELRKREGRIEP